MGFLDSLKDSVNSMVGGKKDQSGAGIQHAEAPGTKKPAKKQGLLSGLFGDSSGKKKDTPPKTARKQSSSAQDGDNDSLSLFDGGSEDDFDYDSMEDEIKGHRSDVLELLDIAEDYPVPSNVLLVGDLDRVRFDISQPKGYDTKMVEEFYDSVRDSISWYVEKLQQRNNDIRKMEDMLNKQNTDLHNAKVAEAMSDPEIAVMTGYESSEAQELQEAQIRIMNLEEENRQLQKKLQAAGNGASDQMDAETQSRYDALQNQLGIVQRENQKLKAQLKRQAMEEAASMDRQQGEYTTADDYDDDYPLAGHDDGADLNGIGAGMPMPSGGGMPMPSSNDPGMGGGMPMPDAPTPSMPGPSMDMPVPGGAMPTPGGAAPMGSHGAGRNRQVNPFSGGPRGASASGRSIDSDLINPSMETGRVGENTASAMSMQDALDADDDYDLDMGGSSDSHATSVEAGFGDPFSFDYEGGDDSSGPRRSNGPAPIPTSIDDGNFEEINLLDDDEDDDDDIISLDDGLFD